MLIGPVSVSAYYCLLRQNRNFRLLWCAQTVSEIGDWLYSVAIYSMLLELTGSAKAVAVAVVLQVLPQFFIAPLAGVACDRLSRRKIMVFSDLARAVIVLGMFAVARLELVWGVYVLLMLQCFMWGFFEPARSAVIPNLTRDRQETLVANALASTTWSVNLAVGSFIGGVVAVMFGRPTVFALNSATFLTSALLVQAMRFAEPHVSGAPPLRLRDLTDFTPVVEGVRYVLARARLFANLLAKTGLGLLGIHWVILPIFGERIFPVAVEQLGEARAAMLGMSILMGSRGIGALLGPLFAGRWAGTRHSRLLSGIAFGFLMLAVGYAGLWCAPSILVAVAAVVLSHAGSSIVWVFSTTLLHFQTEDRFRGRVFSADFAFMVVAMSAVSYASGCAVDFGISVRTIALATGVLALLPALLWIFHAMPLWKGQVAVSVGDEPGS